MRKFIFILVLAGFSLAAWADELPARQGLIAFRAPMEAIVKEAAKGQKSDLDEMARMYKGAGDAWQQVAGQALDLGQYGVPVDRQEDVWRQVRTMSMLVGYMDEAIKRGNRGLMLRSAELLTPAYEKLAASLGVR
ncbi:MAG TPA: hypothetical protein VFF82_01685 [Rhodocyclaceae bacterium]|nr:hypothetical protein [Rhodocyclaceae bacterium]